MVAQDRPSKSKTIRHKLDLAHLLLVFDVLDRIGKVCEESGKRLGGELRVQPVEVEQAVLAQLVKPSGLCQVVAKFTELSQVVPCLKDKLGDKILLSQRTFPPDSDLKARGISGTWRSASASLVLRPNLCLCTSVYLKAFGLPPP